MERASWLLGWVALWAVGCSAVVDGGADSAQGGGDLGGALEEGGGGASADGAGVCSACGPKQACQHDWSEYGDDCYSCVTLPETCLGSEDVCRCVEQNELDSGCQLFSCEVHTDGTVGIRCEVQSGC